MDTCPRCNTNQVYDGWEFCEDCLNSMLLGGTSYVFVPDENFFKEIGHIDSTKPPSNAGAEKGMSHNVR